MQCHAIVLDAADPTHARQQPRYMPSPSCFCQPRLPYFFDSGFTVVSMSCPPGGDATDNNNKKRTKQHKQSKPSTTVMIIRLTPATEQDTQHYPSQEEDKKTKTTEP